MPKDTNADPDVLRDVAGKIGALLDDMSVFENLKSHKPDAGAFDMATWLENVVQRQVHNLAAHGENLKEIFELMSRDLVKVADRLQDQDADSAKEIAEIITDMPETISNAIGGDSGDGKGGSGDDGDGKGGSGDSGAGKGGSGDSGAGKGDSGDSGDSKGDDDGKGSSNDDDNKTHNDDAGGNADPPD